MRWVIYWMWFVCVLGISLARAQDASGHVLIGTAKNEEGRSVIATRDGGYAVVGIREEDPFTKKMYVVKLDSTGALEWAQVLGLYRDNLVEYGLDLVQTRDGGYVLVGTTEDLSTGIDILVVKLDSLGMIQWSKKIGGEGDEEAYSIVEDDDGGLVMVGFSNSFVDSLTISVFVAKLHADGSLAWSRIIDAGGYEFGFSIVKANDGGFVLTGLAVLDFSLPRMYLIKLDENGDFVWSRFFHGGEGAAGQTVVAVPGQGYIAMGKYIIPSAQTEEKLCLIAVDEDGDPINAYFYDIERNEAEYLRGSDMALLEDGGFAIVATDYNFQNEDENKTVILRLQQDGSVAWAFHIQNEKAAQLSSVIEANDSSLVMVGSNASFGKGGKDVWVLKVNAEGRLHPACPETLSPLKITLDTSVQLVELITLGDKVEKDLNPTVVVHDMDVSSFGSSELCGQFFVPREIGEKATKLVQLEGRQGWRLDFAEEQKVVEIMVANPMGRTVFRHREENVTSVRIEFPKPEGIYILKVDTDQEQLLYKLH